MAKRKLNCWKKEKGKLFWSSKSVDGGLVEVFKNSRTKKYSTAFVPVTGKDKFLKSGTTKKEAIRVAKSYMKKHNVC